MQIMRDDTEKPRSPRSVDAETARSRQQLIGRKLRDMYDSVLDEGVPDDFEQLLSALDQAEDQPAAAGNAPAGSAPDKPGEGRSDG